MSGGECCSLGSPALPALTSFALLPPGIAAAWSFPVPSHKLSSAPAIHHPHPPASCVFHPPPLKRPCPLTQPHTLACKRCRRATPRATGLDPPNRERTYRAEPAPLSIPLLPLPVLELRARPLTCQQGLQGRRGRSGTAKRSRVQRGRLEKGTRRRPRRSAKQWMDLSEEGHHYIEVHEIRNAIARSHDIRLLVIEHSCKVRIARSCGWI